MADSELWLKNATPHETSFIYRHPISKERSRVELPPLSTSLIAKGDYDLCKNIRDQYPDIPDYSDDGKKLNQSPLQFLFGANAKMPSAEDYAEANTIREEAIKDSVAGMINDTTAAQTNELVGKAPKAKIAKSGDEVPL
jgi:hypothetical protein